MSSNLKEKQIMAAELMAQGMSNRSIAHKLDVVEETICRWKREPEFKELVRQKSEELTNQIRERSIGLYFKAVEHLGEYFEEIWGTTDKSPEIAIKIIKQFQPLIQTQSEALDGQSKTGN